MPKRNRILSRNIKQARLKVHLTQQQAADQIDNSLLHFGRLELWR